MSRLLSADFYRLKKDLVFWITVLATLALSIFKLIDSVLFNSNNPEDSFTLNQCMFEVFPFASLCYAAFVALFIGKEYSEGTLRNKLVVGHARRNIYISNYITCLAGTLFIYAVLIIVGLMGVFFIGKWQGNISDMIISIIMGAFITASITALLTTLSMLNSNRAINGVVAIVVSLLLMIVASIIYNGLCEPEYTREFISMSMDSVEYGPEIPNPVYVSGVQRTVYEFLLQFMPQGQSILIANNEVTNPVLNIIYCIICTVVMNEAGIFAFKKKDLK